MEHRLHTLESAMMDARERLVRIETRLDATATRADLHEAVLSLAKWMAGAGLALLGLAAATAKLIF